MVELPPGFSRETRIRRDGRGRWFDGEVPIDQPKIERAFDAWVDIAADGRFCLKNSVNWAYITIEGAPVFVRHVRATEGLHLVLSDTRVELLDPSSLFTDREGGLFCRVRHGRLLAQFDTASGCQLAEWLVEDAGGVYLEWAGERHLVRVRA